MAKGLQKEKLQDKYTQTPNEIFIDKRLRPQSVRVLGYLWSKKKGWVVWNKVVSQDTGVTVEMLAKVWKELEVTGWIVRTQVKYKHGLRYDYSLNKTPNHGKAGYPIKEKQDTPTTEKQDHSNTDSNNTEISKNAKPTAFTSKVPNFLKGKKPLTSSNTGSSAEVLKQLGTVQGLEPQELKEIYDADKTKQAFPKLWKGLVRHYHPKLQIMGNMPGKEVGLLHLLAKHIDKKDRADKLDKALKNWLDFTKHCVDIHGGFKPPKYPSVVWVHKHMYALNTFYEEEVFDVFEDFDEIPQTSTINTNLDEDEFLNDD